MTKDWQCQDGLTTKDILGRSLPSSLHPDPRCHLHSRHALRLYSLWFCLPTSAQSPNTQQWRLQNILLFIPQLVKTPSPCPLCSHRNQTHSYQSTAILPFNTRLGSRIKGCSQVHLFIKFQNEKNPVTSGYILTLGTCVKKPTGTVVLTHFASSQPTSRFLLESL